MLTDVVQESTVSTGH